MGSKKTGNGVENVYAAAGEWIERALLNDDSLFAPGNAIWTAERLAELRRRFLDQPDESGDNFYVKLERQLRASAPEIHQLMGEVLYLHVLIIWEPSMRSETKKDRVERVLALGAPVRKVPHCLADGLAPGFVNLGAGYSKNLPFMVGFIINFVEQWKALEPDKHRRMLEDPWAFKDFATKVELQGKLYLESMTRHRGQIDALLHLVHPDDFEPMTSRGRKAKIANAFAHLVQEPTDDVDRKLRQIRSSLEIEYESIDFFDPSIRIRWDDKVAASTVPAMLEEHARLRSALKNAILAAPAQQEDYWIAMGIDEVVVCGKSLESVMASIEAAGMAGGTIVTELVSAEPQLIVL